MGQPLRYENPNEIFFITSRTIGTRLWFIHNRELEYLILAYLAKYQELYGVILYSFILMGNHYHLKGKFPNRNKSAFMRSFNAIIAKLTGRKVKYFDGGPLWARRYADQAVRGSDAIENWHFYSALNPVLAGVCQRVGEYEGYNSFHDAASGIHRKFKLFNESAYYEAKRWNCEVKRKDFIEEYTLQFERIPGYENLSQEEYRKLMYKKLEERRIEAVRERIAQGKGFATKETRRKTLPGSKPISSKTSTRYSFRPLVLTLCRKTKAEFLNFYFKLKDLYTEASKEYRKGNLFVKFPEGTYAPPLLRC